MRRPILNQLEAPRTGFNPLLGSGPRSQPPTDRARLYHGLLTQTKTGAGLPVTRNASPHPRERAQLLRSDARSARTKKVDFRTVASLRRAATESVRPAR